MTAPAKMSPASRTDEATAAQLPFPCGRTATEERLRLVIERHFDPDWGSPYWLERSRDLGLDARREIHRLEDLDRLGFLDDRVLRSRPVWDFVPRSVRRTTSRFVVVDSGGTLGRPSRAVFTDEEFHSAFVAPFLAAVDLSGAVPRNAAWVFIGPSGPHAIGKAARQVCRAMGSADPFEVDFDPRWYKSQKEGSFDRRRYMRHVIDQAVDVFRRESIGVVFGTPPVLVALARDLGDSERESVLAVHLGGLAASPREVEEMTAAYPNASFLSGYGNSLLGLCPQLRGDSLTAPVFHPHGARLWLRLVVERPDAARELRREDATGNCVDVVPGERGRLLATRLDESFLIVNLRERDTAIRHPPLLGGAAYGFGSDAFGEPRPVESVDGQRLGIY